MEAYGAILNLVVPIFFILFFIEKGFEWYLGKKVIRGLDSVSSFSSGITNVVKDVLGLSVSVVSYGWLMDKIAIVHIQATWLVYAIAFVAVDFQGYWVHRWSHERPCFAGAPLRGRIEMVERDTHDTHDTHHRVAGPSGTARRRRGRALSGNGIVRRQRCRRRRHVRAFQPPRLSS